MLLRLPLWARWVAALLAFSTLGAALVVLSRDGDGGYSRDRAGEAEANRLARIVVTEDQKPRTAAWGARTRARRQLERAITRHVRARLRRGQLTGDLSRVRCRPLRPGSSGRLKFSCSAVIDGVAYRFAGVADRRTRRLTWCKRDPAPDPASEVPLGRRCTS